MPSRRAAHCIACLSAHGLVASGSHGRCDRSAAADDAAQCRQAPAGQVHWEEAAFQLGPTPDAGVEPRLRSWDSGRGYAGAAFPSKVGDIDLDFFERDSQGFFLCPRFSDAPEAVFENLTALNIPAVFPGYAEKWRALAEDGRLARELSHLAALHLQLAPAGRANELRRLRGEPFFLAPGVLEAAEPAEALLRFLGALANGRHASLRARPLERLDHGAAGELELEASELNASDVHLYMYAGLEGSAFEEISYPALLEDGWKVSSRSAFLLSGKFSSGLHGDWFENLYANVEGEREFLLLPGHEVGNLYVGRARGDPSTLRWAFSPNRTLGLHRSYAPSGAPYSLVPDLQARLAAAAGKPPPAASSGEPPVADDERFPRLRAVRAKFRCKLRAGDLLFLPAGWLHDVRTVAPVGRLGLAVNTWLSPPPGLARYSAWLARMSAATQHIVEDVTRKLRRGEAGMRSSFVNLNIGERVPPEADGYTLG